MARNTIQVSSYPSSQAIAKTSTSYWAAWAGQAEKLPLKMYLPTDAEALSCRPSASSTIRHVPERDHVHNRSSANPLLLQHSPPQISWHSNTSAHDQKCSSSWGNKHPSPFRFAHQRNALSDVPPKKPSGIENQQDSYKLTSVASNSSQIKPCSTESFQ